MEKPKSAFMHYFTSDAFPTFAAVLVALVGGINIVSALYPALPLRLHLLRDMFSFEYIESARTLTILVGFLLIILSIGLDNRRKRAYHISLFMLLLACALNLLKGLDFEETVANGFIALLLFLNRKKFYVASPIPSFFEVAKVTIISLVIYYCYIFAGFYILQIAIRPAFSFYHVFAEPYNMFFDIPYYHYIHREGKWFADSIIIVGSLWFIYVLIQFLRPLLPRFGLQVSEKEHIQKLIKQYGSDSLSYFSLQDDRLCFINSTNTAFLSYRIFGSVAVVAADPIGKQTDLPLLIEEFLAYTDAHGIKPCFLCVSKDMLSLFEHYRLNQIKIGEEAVISLTDFSSAVFDKKVRRAVRRNEEEGVAFEVYTAKELPFAIRNQLRLLAIRWLVKKGHKHLGYSMTLGRFPTRQDGDCLIFIARKGRRILAYFTLVPVYKESSWSLDQMRRAEDAPNGITEFLIIKGAEYLKSKGYKHFSLNFATFADSSSEVSSQALKQLQAVMFDYLSSVYQLKSLYTFNSKFHPQWKSRYIVFPNKRYFPQYMLAIMQAERSLSLKIPFLRD